MATEVAVSVGSKIGEYLMGQIDRQFGYLIHYKSNIENLMKQVEKLKDKRAGLQRIVDAASRNGDIIGDDVQRWLESVDELCENATIFYEGEVKQNNGCLKGWCPNLKACYTLSKKAKKKAVEAAELQKGVFERISYPAPPVALGFTSMGDFKSFKSRETTIKNFMSILKGDEVSMIGICGMGGVGKTTMVKEIARRVRDEKLFDEIVMAVVSQNQDSMKIQDEIADHLGLKFEEKTSLTVRAGRLWQRLMPSSKGNLVILDDMWESFDLKEIGIPYGGEHKKCKIVMTSRSKDVCNAMSCGMIFEIEVLSEKEAWNLFREMAGGSVDAPDLYLTASNVAKECGGLPIAVITLGKALNDKSKEVWDDALIQLRKSIVPTTLSEVEPKVYRSLQLTYDHLGSKEAKSLFLLCCLFPEDASIPLEDLVRYGVGLRLFEGIDLITEARDRVHALTMKLKGCFLLLDGDKRFYVKLHDVVRDVGILIASKENHFSMMMIHGGGWPKVKDHAYKDCNALSVISNTISDLPSGGLDCPNLEVLQLACKNLSLEALNSRNVFGGMPGLRVLDMWDMPIRSLPSSVRLLTNLRVLCLEDHGVDNIREIHGELGNLEILIINDTYIQELPENIGMLTNLRLLDLRNCYDLTLIPPSVFSCLHVLEDLHTGDWEPAEEGDKSGNASFSELESLSNLTSLVIRIPHARFLPKNPFLKKLKRYVIVVGLGYSVRKKKYLSKNCFLEKALSMEVDCINDAPLGGGIDYLLKQSTETLSLDGDGVKPVLDQLFPGGSRHLRKLYINKCNGGVENLVDTGRAELVPPKIGVFAKLEKLHLDELGHLKEICHGQQLPAGSFGNLQKMNLTFLPALNHLWEYQNQSVKLSKLRFVSVFGCKRLENLFTLSVARSLVNLESLEIGSCETMEEVIINQGPPGTTKTDNHKIEFPKLIKLSLFGLDSLTCFSKGIDQINLPQLTDLEIELLPKLLSLCPEGNRNVALEDNDSVHLQSLFNHKVTFPLLGKLHLSNLPNFEELWCSQISTGSFQKVRVLKVWNCDKLVNIIPSHMFKVFSSLEELEVSRCNSMEELFDSKGVHIEGGYQETLIEGLKSIKVHACDHIRNLFPSSTARGLVHLQQLKVDRCRMIEEIFTEKADEDGREDKTLFPTLEILELRELPRLKSFCNVNYTIELPVLKQVWIYDCSEMTTFSSSFVSTRKLDGVSDRWGKKMWMGNLNKTIEHHLKGKEIPEQEIEDDWDEIEDDSDEIEDDSDEIEETWTSIYGND